MLYKFVKFAQLNNAIQWRRIVIPAGPSLEDFINTKDKEEALSNFDNRMKLKAGDKRLRLPEWLKRDVTRVQNQKYSFMKKQLGSSKLATVCQEARCPNIEECWSGSEGSSSTATIMLMGDTCTRGCRFCSVKTSNKPPPLDPDEPMKTAEAIAEWGVGYVVLTSVDRDDLPDYGASHIAETVKCLKKKCNSILIECLVPDFAACQNPIETVVDSGLDVYAHNLETTKRLTPFVRDPRAKYQQSLDALKHAKQVNSSIVTKSSLMLGLGETDDEVKKTMEDLRNIGVEALTLGQYVQPTKRHLLVKEWILPEKFDYWREVGENMGFLYTASGPLVRSSYKAGEYYLSSIVRRRKHSS